MKALRMLAKKLGVTPEYLETGSELDASELRELRLAEQELRLRLDGAADVEAVRELLADADGAADIAAATRARIVLGLEAAARGDHAGTIEQLSQVVGSELVTAASRPDVFSTLGRAYAAAGSPREAVALFERALDEVGRVEPENMHARVRYSTYLSYALTDLGELQRAKAVVGELFAGAGEAPTATRGCGSTGRSGGSRSSRRSRSRRSTASAARWRCSRRPRTPSTSRGPTWRAPTRRSPPATTSAGRSTTSTRPSSCSARRRPPRTSRRSAGCRRCARRPPATGRAPSTSGRQALLLAEEPAERARQRLARRRRGACRAGGAEGADDAFREALALLAEHGTVRAARRRAPLLRPVSPRRRARARGPRRVRAGGRGRLEPPGRAAGKVSDRRAASRSRPPPV